MIVPNLGCHWSCHFCSLGVPPYRQASIELLIQFVDQLEQIGVEQIVISSPTFTQYSWRYALLEHIKSYKARTGRNVSTIIGSIRADEITARYLDSVASLGNFGHLFTELRLNNLRGFITIAPEFGSEDLVSIFNKRMTKQRVYKAIELCKQNGYFQNIMMYFIVGVPGETEVDRLRIADYAVDVFNRLEQEDCTIVLKLQQFVPTINTVSQRLEMSNPALTAGYIERIAERIRMLTSDRIFNESFRVLWGETNRLMFESICGRGDRKIGRVLEDLHCQGIDASNISVSEFSSVLSKHGLDYTQYLRRIETDEVVPWQIVDSVNKRSEADLLSTLDQRQQAQKIELIEA